MKHNLEIEIISDAICPWCYLGKKRLEKAMHSLSEDFQFSIEWKPYQLNPDMPIEGMKGNELLEKKYGKEKSEEMLKNMTELGKLEGIQFNFQNIPYTPNTIMYHRMIKYASLFNKQNEMVNFLFGAYFEKGEDLTDLNLFLKYAELSGLDREETEKFLKSSEFLEDILSAEEAYRKVGIRGVPSYIINQKYLLVGAQTPDYFQSAFLEIAKS